MEKRKTVKKAVAKKRTARGKPRKARAHSLSPKTRQQAVSPLNLTRISDNPIISPRPEYDWESWQTFNPGAILLDNKVHFLYRAIGSDGVSRFGYASSADGFKIDERLPYPVYEHRLDHLGRCFTYFSFASGGSWGGCEDPRLVRVNSEDSIYMTYTACDSGLRVGLTSIKIDDFLNKKWKWKAPAIISPPNEVHKNWVIFPEKINPVRNGVSNGVNGQYAILHSVSPEILIDYFDILEFDACKYIDSYYGGAPRKNCWDSWIRGAGPPPIKTEYGWLLLYHAIDQKDPGKYKVGAMLLGLRDPRIILRRSPSPILEPNEYYENRGFKSGIVYVSGAVVKDGNLLVYYGAADSYVCVAYANLDEFLEALKRGIKPVLKRKPLRNR